MQALYSIGNLTCGVKRSGPIALTASTDITIVAALGAGKKIRVLAAVLCLTTAGTVQIQSGTGGTALSCTFNQTGAIVFPSNDAGWWETAANALLNAHTGANVVGTIEVVYVEAPSGIDAA